MLFADRVADLKQRGIQDASEVLNYMDQVKQSIADLRSVSDINTKLESLENNPIGLKTRIVERSNPDISGPKNLSIITFDTRAAKHQEQITELALNLTEDPFSIERTALLARSSVGNVARIIIAGVTHRDTVKVIPMRSPDSVNLIRAAGSDAGGRLRGKITRCLLTGRPVQLLGDELQLFRDIKMSRRLMFSELGLKLDNQAILRMRPGNSAVDMSTMYFEQIGDRNHFEMLRAIAHFAQSQPVFITAESPRPQFREWYRIFVEYRYHLDPRIVRGYGAAAIAVEEKTLHVRFPGASEKRAVTGFYFHQIKHIELAETVEDPIQWSTALYEIPEELSLALVKRQDQIPENPQIDRYLMQDGATAYLADNVLGPRGISLALLDPQRRSVNGGRPGAGMLKLYYGNVDYNQFPYMQDCFQPTRVFAALLKKIRDSQTAVHLAGQESQTAELLRIINDVALYLTEKTIDISFLFAQADVRAANTIQRKIQQAIKLCHPQTREYEFLSVVSTALTSALGGQLRQPAR